MKFCNRPFDHVYVKQNGVIECCSWVRFPLGNILDNSLQEVWYGDKAKMVRESILDQSFCYCDAMSCPLLNNDSLPDLDQEVVSAQINEMSGAPIEFNLAYDFVCNHACPSCRSGIFTPDKTYRKNMQKIEAELLPYLHDAKLLMASGNGDVFSSKSMLEMLSKIEPTNQNFVLKLETNGSLVENKWEHIKRFENLDVKVVVTPNSFEPETYTKLSGGLENLEDTLQGLKFLSDLRKENKISEFKITMVVQEANFREIPSFIARCLDEFEPDLVQLRPIMPWFKISKEDYLKNNLLNPRHPHHNEYLKIISLPICSHPKVYHWNGVNNVRDSIAINDFGQEDYEKLNNKLRALNSQEEEFILYGAGTDADYMMKTLDASKVVGFIDADQSKSGTRYLDKPIMHLVDISKLGNHRIIITLIGRSMAVMSNLNQNFGIPEERMIHFDDLYKESEY